MFRIHSEDRISRLCQFSCWGIEAENKMPSWVSGLRNRSLLVLLRGCDVLFPTPQWKLRPS